MNKEGMDMQSLIAFLSLVLAIATTTFKTAMDKGRIQQRQKDQDEQMRKLEDDIRKVSEQRTEQDTALMMRVASLERQQAVTEATCQSLKTDMNRIEEHQITQGEKIDKLLEMVYKLVPKVTNE